MTMKKLLYIFAAAAALSTVSCVKENFNEGQEGTTTFYGKAVDVKTQVVDGHTVWSANDNIKVFYNNTDVVAELKTGENTSSATFEAAVGTATDYYAVYPASETATMADGVMTVTLPSTQSGLFGAGHVAVAKAEDKTFTFTNVNAFLKMTFASAQYTRIVVESVGGQALAGDLSVSFAGDAPVVAETFQNASSSVEVTSETTFPAGDLYISVLPGVTHTQGVLVSCYNGAEKVGSYLVDKPVITEPSVTLTFDVFEPNGNYYVTAEGAGNNNGLSLANAMPVAKMVALLQKSTTDEAACVAVDGAVFNIAAGEYVLAEEALALAYETAEPVKLTFKADGEVAFSGNETHSIMAVSGADVTLDGITITKSVATETKTGAIKVSGENSKLTLSKCTFLENTVDGSEILCAGVAATEGAELVMTGCEAIDNNAYTAAVLYVNSADLNVTETLFQGNWVNDDAGVALFEGEQESSFTNCNFKSNAAYKHGMLQHAGGNTTFTNCTFTENTIAKGCDGSVFTILANSTGNLVVNGGEMSGNYAGWGAAVYQERGAKLYLNDVVIKNNECEGSGAIWTEGEASLTRCILDGNLAKEDDKNYNSAHALTLAKGADMKLYGCTIQNHKSTNRIPAVVVRGGASLYIGADSQGNRSLVKNNSANYAAIRLSQKNSEELATLHAEQTTFEENYAKYGGAIIATFVADVTLDDVTFNGNYTIDGNGGAILFESSGTLACNRCHFEGNHCRNEGGAIKVDHGDAKIYFNASTFKGNYSEKVIMGTTMLIHQAGAFAMNNCTIADDTYATSNHASEPRISWLNFNEPKKIWMSNNTLIGVPRENGTPTYGGLVRLWLDVDTDAYMVNNIVVSETQENTWALCQLDKSVAQGTHASLKLYHTKYSAIENPTGSAPMLTYIEDPTSSGFTSDSFGELTWNASKCYWSWNGTMTGGANTNKITKDQFVSTLNDALPEFKTWLESINALDKDQLGNSRGNGEWWPGSYQKN